MLDMSDLSSFSSQYTSKSSKNIFGFIYDIPKNDSITSSDLTSLFEENDLKGRVQMISDDNKPFFTARVKFENEEHLKKSLELMRYFKVKGKTCRFLPYEPIL